MMLRKKRSRQASADEYFTAVAGIDDSTIEDRERLDRRDDGLSPRQWSNRPLRSRHENLSSEETDATVAEAAAVDIEEIVLCSRTVGGCSRRLDPSGSQERPTGVSEPSGKEGT
jgi:hypothetical protein